MAAFLSANSGKALSSNGWFLRLRGDWQLPLHAYAPRKGGYRLVADGGMGWAFGVVDSKATVPGLVFASNGGGGQASLGLYRYVGGRYLLQACETLIKKDRADASCGILRRRSPNLACGAPSRAPLQSHQQNPPRRSTKPRDFEVGY